MADAMKLDLNTVVRIYSGFDFPFPDMGCTALVQNGYYVRNYDFSPVCMMRGLSLRSHRMAIALSA